MVSLVIPVSRETHGVPSDSHQDLGIMSSPQIMHTFAVCRGICWDGRVCRKRELTVFIQFRHGLNHLSLHDCRKMLVLRRSCLSWPGPLLREQLFLGKNFFLKYLANQRSYDLVN